MNGNRWKLALVGLGSLAALFGTSCEKQNWDSTKDLYLPPGHHAEGQGGDHEGEAHAADENHGGDEHNGAEEEEHHNDAGGTQEVF